MGIHPSFNPNDGEEAEIMAGYRCPPWSCHPVKSNRCPRKLASCKRPEVQKSGGNRTRRINSGGNRARRIIRADIGPGKEFGRKSGPILKNRARRTIIGQNRARRTNRANIFGDSISEWNLGETAFRKISESPNFCEVFPCAQCTANETNNGS